ncbi:hypothetical protein [Gottfriedia solisilvae]|uniref:hypothetical protein n=1 Tax=Gottfriedia solisilvae TaxID=1516104 RepID=UPI003D2F37F5
MKKTYMIFLVLLLIIVSGCTKVFDTEPPEALAIIKNKEIALKRGGYHWTTEEGALTKATIADAASPNQIAQDLIASPVEKGSEATIKFSDHSKPQLTYNFWEGDQTGESISMEGNKITFPSNSGKYVIEVNATWSNGDASYTFVIDVK